MTSSISEFFRHIVWLGILAFRHVICLMIQLCTKSEVEKLCSSKFCNICRYYKFSISYATAQNILDACQACKFLQQFLSTVMIPNGSSTVLWKLVANSFEWH